MLGSILCFDNWLNIWLSILLNIGFNICFNIVLNIGFNICFNIGFNIWFNIWFNIGFHYWAKYWLQYWVQYWDSILGSISVQDVPMNLHLKFHKNRASNNGDVADIEFVWVVLVGGVVCKVIFVSNPTKVLLG